MSQSQNPNHTSNPKPGQQQQGQPKGGSQQQGDKSDQHQKPHSASKPGATKTGGDAGLG